MLHCSKPENMPSHKGVKAIFVQCTKNFQARAGGREEREIESLEEVLTAGDKDFRARHIAEVGIAELIDSARDLLGPAHALERNAGYQGVILRPDHRRLDLAGRHGVDAHPQL